MSVMAAPLRVNVTCPACAASVFGAAGRGFCKDCFITFALPRPSRRQVLAVFVVQYYTAQGSSHYHVRSCKYVKNILPENLITLSEPVGKPCKCVR